ncbi:MULTISPECIES: hypothetical protein [Aeromonas]|jgi:hypothetical protein|nr:MULTISPECIES: hypothetical protein [Aeromonas]MDF2402005.1 hypothetical protein [Aeromonas sp. 5HA1]MDM5125766.1 hypothetical protein [Aeromonas salmonicida]MDM5148741.1 hypothetical protein [Aeromonas salmonicida]RSM28229.1 hypothetical protein C5B76_06215 [Aeromonas salmonicida]RSM32670.1 hypothetical protein C5B77_07480 [Aeromonas salmonicida]
MMSLVRLPTLLLARLLLALMLVCNLTLCISWHGTDVISSTMTTGSDNATMSATAMQGLACHTMAADDGEQGNAMSQGDCQMHGGLTSPTGAGLPLLAALLTLLVLPLLLLPHLGVASHLFDHWLRDPFLRSRGTHPPSWPRRHLMLSVLRH